MPFAFLVSFDQVNFVCFSTVVDREVVVFMYSLSRKRLTIHCFQFTF